MVFVKLPEPPGDGTTALRFAPDGSSLLASSWDSILRLYGAAPSACALRATLPQPSPLLDCDFVDARTVASGGLDGAVRLSPLDGAGGERVLGEHAGAARCVRRWRTIPSARAAASRCSDLRSSPTSSVTPHGLEPCRLYARPRSPL